MFSNIFPDIPLEEVTEKNLLSVSISWLMSCFRIRTASLEVRDGYYKGIGREVVSKFTPQVLNRHNLCENPSMQIFGLFCELPEALQGHPHQCTSNIGLIRSPKQRIR